MRTNNYITIEASGELSQSVPYIAPLAASSPKALSVRHRILLTFNRHFRAVEIRSTKNTPSLGKREIVQSGGWNWPISGPPRRFFL